MGFGSTDYTFIVVPSFGGESIVDEDPLTHVFESHLGRRLTESGKLSPEVTRVCASWVLARLRALEPLIPAESETTSDGGGYCLDVAVAFDDEVVGTFKVRGDAAGVAVSGRSSDSQTGDRLLAQFGDCLLAEPHTLSECCYRVLDPEWAMEPDCFDPTPDHNSRNEYGWKDGRCLGADNILEE